VHPPPVRGVDRVRAPRWRPIAAGAGFVVAATALQLVRQPMARSWNTMWAEDGRVYLRDAFAHPVWATLLRGYNGYAQLVPRLLVVPARVLPASWWAPYFAVAGALGASLLGLAAVRSARGWIHNAWLRWLLGFVVTLAPVATLEITGNITNLNWTWVAASFWLIASRQRGPADTVLRSGVVALGALTTPLQLVMWPWAVVVAIVRRRRGDYVVVASLTVGLAIQGIAYLATSQAPVRGRPTVHEVVKVYVARVLGSVGLGERWLPHWWDLHPHGVEVAVVVGLVVVILLARPWRAPRGQLALAAAALAMSVWVFAFSLWFRGSGAVELFTRVIAIPGGSRYVYPPSVFIVSGLLVLVDASGRAWLKALLAAQVILITVSSLTVTTPRSYGPTWSTELARAETACRRVPADRRGSTTVTIPITPYPAWHVELSCQQLLDSAT
jgi:hypothetical protein